jgi:PKD repeat protein
MKILKPFLLFLLIAGQFSLIAQTQDNDIKFCKTTEVNEELLLNNPELVIERQAYAKAIDEFIKNNPKDDETYIIPVVFHVIHNYGPENISKAQIEDQIRILNEDYNLLNPDTTYIIDEFKNLAANCNFEFRLAKLDPDGNCTDGITRTVSELTYNGGEEVKQIAPTWNRTNRAYLNIWVVNRIPGAAGYSFYPYSNDTSYAGILMTYSYVGSIEEGSAGRSRTLTHEIGHYLDLPHPWGSTNDPELPENCGIDDGIEDTPNTIGHTSCSLYAITCGSLDNVQNYMDYSYCAKMFTIGQSERMYAALNVYPTRQLLWQPDNLINTGVFDPEALAECVPVPDFSQNENIGCEGMEVQFFDLSYNTDVIDTWEWQFEGGTPTVSNEQNPIVTYSSAGKYNVSLTVSNSVGNDTKSVANKISIYNPDDALILPVQLDIENDEFPQIPASEYNDFYLIEGGNKQWERTDSAASSGQHSMRIINRYNDINTNNSFITPAFKLDTLDFPLNIYFDVAYSKKESTTNDILKIYLSDDCGQNWRIQYYKSGNSLATTDYYSPYGTYTPTEDEWREESFAINPAIFWNSSSLRIRFETVSKGGNTMYIDNINVINDVTSIVSNKSLDVKIYPNPFEDVLYFETEGNEKLDIVISDIFGRVLSQSTINKGETITDISQLIPSSATGLLMIKIIGENSSGVFKVQKTQ